MLEQQGACPVLDTLGNTAVLLEPERIPFKEASFDRILCAHAIEQCPMSTLLHEIERVLIPLGEAILILPNRRGLWSRIETTPWAFGNAYSLKRIRALLAQTRLMMAGIAPVLYMPPSHHGLMIASGGLWEGLGHALPQKWAGVFVIRVIKQVYAMAEPKRTPRRRNAFILKPVPLFAKRPDAGG
jgi:SAM-dependent methyltransferase